MSPTLVNVLTVAGTVLGLLAVPPLWRDRRKRRRHARDIWARLNSRYEWVAEDTMIRRGGSLTLQNNGVLPVTNVHIESPTALGGWHYEVLAAGERIELDLDEALMQRIGAEEQVTLQIFDSYDGRWSWTPSENKLEPQGRRPHLLGRVFQRQARAWPPSWHEAFHQLPMPIQEFLWGYDPSGGEGPVPAGVMMNVVNRFLAVLAVVCLLCLTVLALAATYKLLTLLF